MICSTANRGSVVVDPTRNAFDCDTLTSFLAAQKVSLRVPLKYLYSSRSFSFLVSDAGILFAERVRIEEYRIGSAFLYL